MSKVICNVCGTAYPESATQCPICGSVRSADAKSVATDAAGEQASTYTHVRGGRFSKSNVRKRNRKAALAGAAKPAASATDETPTEKKSNKGLVLAIVLLLLAIVAVVIYIVLTFFAPGQPDKGGTETTTTAAGESTELTVPCQDLALDLNTIILDGELGEARMLYVTPTPADTTDEIFFVSSDESVATVSSVGKITVVSNGVVVITVTCGNATAECTVICNVPDVTEDTTEDTTEEVTYLDEELVLTRKDITFKKQGDGWTIYSGNVPVDQITWSTDDDAIATVENGRVIAVGPGTTKVYAEYGEQKVSCIIRCVFAASSETEGVGGTGGVSEDGGSSANAVISHTDVTLSASTNETFTLTLSVDGQVVSVTWSVADASFCSVNGNKVTALSIGTTTVSTTYGGQTYSCIVRVIA